MVGIASNYIRIDLHISDAKANLLPSLVYIWFLIVTIPAGVLMNKIGRKNTVLLSMCVMTLSMIFPLFGASYHFMLFCFILLGISNVCMQTSLYPMVSNIISGKGLARSLTIGQFVKTLSSFSAPYIAMLGALHFGHFFGLGWRLLFLFYFIIMILSIGMLYFSKIKNEKNEERAITFIQSFSLLKNKFILLSFIGVMCHVGIDISTNTVAPKIMMYRLDQVIEKASFGASLYFIARLAGCFLWSVFLNKMSRSKFFYISVSLILIAIVGLFFAHSKILIFLFIVLIGIGNANLFPVLFSQAVLSMPENKNVISTLMIMGQAGGAIFPILMGLAFDRIGVIGSLLVLFVGVLYLVFFSLTLHKNQVPGNK